MSRFKAAAIHFALSVLVAATLVAVLYALWYPGSLFEATGGQKLIYLIVGIDVVAGPLLTLLVFKAGKPGLKTDLALIAAAQLAFLGYGFYVATIARPIYIAFSADRFVVVASNELEDADLAQASEQFRTRSFSGPVYVATEQPANREEKMALIQSAIAGRDIEKFPKYYRPYADHKDAIVAAGKPLEELAKLGDEQRTEVERFLATRDDDADLVFVPVTALFKSMAAIISRKNGEIVELLRADPWPLKAHTDPQPAAPQPVPAPAPAPPAAAPAEEAPAPAPADGDGSSAPGEPPAEPTDGAAPTDDGA